MSKMQLCFVLVGLTGGLITLYSCGKKIGNENLNWKHYAVIFLIFCFPPLILPIWSSPLFLFWEKVGITIVLLLAMSARYFSTTKAQETMAKFVKKQKN